MSFTSIPFRRGWVTQVADTQSGLGLKVAEDGAQPPAPREIPRVSAEVPGALHSPSQQLAAVLLPLSQSHLSFSGGPPKPRTRQGGE